MCERSILGMKSLKLSDEMGSTMAVQHSGNVSVRSPYYPIHNYTCMRFCFSLAVLAFVSVFRTVCITNVWGYTEIFPMCLWNLSFGLSGIQLRAYSPTRRCNIKHN